MLKKKAGRIINISSVVGQIGNPGQVSLLCAHALSLARACALSLVPFPVSLLSRALSLSLARSSLSLSLRTPTPSSFLSPCPSSFTLSLSSVRSLCVSHTHSHSYSLPLSPPPDSFVVIPWVARSHSGCPAMHLCARHVQQCVCVSKTNYPLTSVNLYEC